MSPGLVAAGALMSSVDIAVVQPSAANEVRAFFGAEKLGLAGIFTVGALRVRWRRPTRT